MRRPRGGHYGRSVRSMAATMTCPVGSGGTRTPRGRLVRFRGGGGGDGARETEHVKKPRTDRDGRERARTDGRNGSDERR